MGTSRIILDALAATGKAITVAHSAYVRLSITSSRAYAMGMPAQNIRWTADMVRALPDDGRRYELLGGELLVSPAPSHLHQRALRLLYDLVAPYVHGDRLGEVFWSPADIEFAPDTILQPDLFVVPEPLAGQVKQWSEIDTLLLVVEIVSPSTAFGDRNRKRPEYQNKGIPEYWIVDLDARIVECWRPDDSRPEILSEQLIWQPMKNPSALTIALPEYFARVFGKIESATDITSRE